MSASSAQQERPPVVVVMGHVDHGKTTLLDFLRETKLAEREAGGITQATAAYEIEKNGKRITFIDTPGHAAFTKMRQRGASIADVAILVVAADDGVKPQTKEAIGILKETGVPFVVAINKIDKNNADLERTKQDLMSNEVLLEGLGGDVPYMGISAKEGTGVDELLDIVLLVAEMQSLVCVPEGPAKGFVIESHKDARRGIVASVVVKNGKLERGSHIMTAGAEGMVRNLENFIGERVDVLVPSSPALIVGFESIPSVGEAFVAGDLEIIKAQDLHPTEPQEEAITEPQEQEIVKQEEDDKQVVRLLLRADVSGSLEALEFMINELSFEKVQLEVVSREVGDITDGDIKDAGPNGAWIVGFNVKVNKAAENLAKSQQVAIMTSKIIYRLVEEITQRVEAIEHGPEAGEMEVLATFSQQGEKQVIGGKVIKGLLEEDDRFEVVRGGEVVGQGRIKNLQQQKKKVKRIEEGECGMQVRCGEVIQVGDIVRTIVPEE
jgi:translation initiation factor IF-2